MRKSKEHQKNPVDFDGYEKKKDGNGYVQINTPTDKFLSSKLSYHNPLTANTNGCFIYVYECCGKTTEYTRKSSLVRAVKNNSGKTCKSCKVNEELENIPNYKIGSPYVIKCKGCGNTTEYSTKYNFIRAYKKNGEMCMKCVKTKWNKENLSNPSHGPFGKWKQRQLQLQKLKKQSLVGLKKHSNRLKGLKN